MRSRPTCPSRPLSVSAEALKRFDLVFLGVNLGLGLDRMEGKITPAVDYRGLRPTMRTGSPLPSMPFTWGALTWSSFGVHGLIGFELGPPFLRLALDGRVYLPFSQTRGGGESRWRIGDGRWDW